MLESADGPFAHVESAPVGVWDMSLTDVMMRLFVRAVDVMNVVDAIVVGTGVGGLGVGGRGVGGKNRAHVPEVKRRKVQPPPTARTPHKHEEQPQDPPHPLT